MKRFGIKIKGVVKYQDKFLLLKRWYDDRITDPYQWEFVDGDLEYGISPDAYVNQIIKQSTGLDSTIDGILYTWSYALGDTQYVGIAYLCHVDSDMVILSEDISEYMWATSDELPAYIENKGILDDLDRLGIL